jgi:hypothetical protein
MSTVGVHEGIEHGTARGFRQHSRRQITPCGPCREARDAERVAKGGDPTARDRTASARSLLPAPPNLTDRQRRRGVRLLAANATDATDLRELLAAVALPASDGFLYLDPS